MKLRNFCEADAKPMLEWMHDAEVNRFFQEDFAHKTMKDVQAFLHDAEDASSSLHYAVCDDADAYQGTISLKHIDPAAGAAEYAIVLRRQAQGKGYARFATREILRIAFEEKGLQEVYLNVLEQNQRAVRFYERMGFRRNDALRDEISWRGKPAVRLWYEMTEETYRLATYG